MTVRPRVHQVLATLGYGDAIGHEVLGIQRVLRSAGFQSEIFVETADHRLEDRTIDYREMVGTVADDDVLVHHFSIGSRASRTAYALPGRMVLVYHNITPPQYFVGVHRDLVKQCFRGRRELTAYIDRSDLALGDSEYNRVELEGLGFPRTGVLPVVPDFSHLDGPASSFLSSAFDDGWTNVMFVGRVIPNKKFETIIRAFHVYRTRHNPRARLLLVGSHSGFERYLCMLQELVASLGTPDVHFLGHVSNEELTALYDVADLFLCASAHEGFCVPIVEAFYKRIPVLAFASTAVPATMDGGGVLYDTTDPLEIARLMEAVLDNPELEEGVPAVAGCRARPPAGAGFRRHAAAIRGWRHRRPAAARAGGRVGLLGPVRTVRPVRGTAAVSAGAVPGVAGLGARGSGLGARSRGRQPHWSVPDPRPAIRDPRDPSPKPRTPTMIINQWVPAAHRGDAIGDSARSVRDMLRRQGHESDIYALTIDDDLRSDIRPFADPGATRGDVTIFHFALPSPMTEAFRRLVGGGRVLQYHNITPAGFFADYAPELFRLAAIGRQELASLVGHVDLALGDSEFNRRELEDLGFAPTGVLPIAVDTGRITNAPRRPALEKILGDGLINILFVGRIVPNKRIDDHIRLAEVYKRYVDSYYRFIFVGRYDGVPAYYAQVRALIAEYRMLPDRFWFTGPVPDEDLGAFYRWADAYVSLSEHEGFCVPLIEAMAADVPVLAYAAGAVPETLGGSGLLFAPKDLEVAAEMLGMLVYDRPLRARILEGQRQRLKDFAPERIEAQLTATLSALRLR